MLASRGAHALEIRTNMSGQTWQKIGPCGTHEGGPGVGHHGCRQLWVRSLTGEVVPIHLNKYAATGKAFFFSDPVITWSHRCVATRGGSDGTKGHLLHLLHYPYHAGCHPYHAGPPGTRRRIHGPALGPLLPLTHPLSSDGDGTACSVVPNHQRTDFVRGWHLATRAPWGATNHLTRTSTGHLTSTHMNSVVNVTTTDGTAHGAIHGGVHLWHNPWRHCGAPMVRKVAQVCHPPPPQKKKRPCGAVARQ